MGSEVYLRRGHRTPLPYALKRAHRLKAAHVGNRNVLTGVLGQQPLQVAGEADGLVVTQRQRQAYGSAQIAGAKAVRGDGRRFGQVGMGLGIVGFLLGQILEELLHASAPLLQGGIVDLAVRYGRREPRQRDVRERQHTTAGSLRSVHRSVSRTAAACPGPSAAAGGVCSASLATVM